MNEPSNPFKWRVIAESVRGASHKRTGMPNQDQYDFRLGQSGQVVVAAVADGHGNRKSFRSDRGARYAVETAIEQLQAIAEQIPSTSDPISLLRHEVSIELPQRIVREWRERVETDRNNASFSAEEMGALSDSELVAIETNYRIVYGTTLVAVLVMRNWIVFLQLGDGDLIYINDAGPSPIRPLPLEPRSFASETVSLSAQDDTSNSKRPSGGGGPWADFRVKVSPTPQDLPELILLTTDGYPNAFVDDSAFQKVATDILAMGQEEGWGFVSDHLSEWLEEASQGGSGDDVTVVLIVRDEYSEITEPSYDDVESDKIGHTRLGLSDASDKSDQSDTNSAME